MSWAASFSSETVSGSGSLGSAGVDRSMPTGSSMGSFSGASAGGASPGDPPGVDLNRAGVLLSTSP